VSDRRIFGHVDVVWIIMFHVLAGKGGNVEKGGGGWRGLGTGPKNGQFILNVGPASMGIPDYVQRATIPSKKVVLY
jgi:hypothetical protein